MVDQEGEGDSREKQERFSFSDVQYIEHHIRGKHHG
jgi:hypothetical protein